ncbi:MarR family transcriptional regulator [uncultured Desulfosarcina sp.]|uniref:MarR family winged helix-turn-helix transcriptional regulator n=1 Tax=uncultured Desulfosarcina sp. TaxID=218289 RepID=UPI0029C92F6F|nr:MarR family transcriptional regulator [uncultured Desulfosarcina sp.]
MSDKSIKNDSGQALHDLFRELFALHSALSVIMDKVHEQAGLNTSQHKIMRTLIQFEPATVPDMGARLNVSRQFVQTVCNDLLARGLIEFTENPRHKRSKLVKSTETGRITFRKARQKENQIIEQALPEINIERATEARELLKCIRLALNEGP